MPNRVIKESIKRSPQIDSLTWFEEVVFCRLIVTVDDYGCTDGRPVVLKNDLFPTKDSITKKAVEDAVAKLDRVGLVKRYSVDGIPYLYLPSWGRHQRIRNKRRRYPEPPGGGGLPADGGQTSADCPPESNPIPIPSQSDPDSGEDGSRRRFDKPSPGEVGAYCRERQNGIDPQRFWDYYEANGWHIGKNPMKDWKAAVRTWERREQDGGAKPDRGPAAAGEPRQWGTEI